VTVAAESTVAIVTEPTEMAIGVAHKGFVWTEIDIKGRAAHGSRPELGIDAIVKAGPLLVGLEELGRRVASHRHPLLGPATIHASLIEGGHEPSTIPEHCRLTIERRTLPGESLADTEREFAILLARCADADRDFAADTRTLMYRPALETRADHPIVLAIDAAHQSMRGRAAEVTGMSYWADSAFIAAHGIPTVLFGPGGDGAHAEVEWVSITDTVDCARILFTVASSMDHKPLV
ncbi:MAG: M20/M25/M40 family metallo-hydrolase, partial [Nakamurella sp.]